MMKTCIRLYAQVTKITLLLYSTWMFALHVIARGFKKHFKKYVFE